VTAILTKRVRAGAAAGTVLAAALTLTACGAEDASSPAGEPLGTSSPTSSEQPRTGSTAGASPEQVSAAKLAACPTTDLKVAPVANGLPDITLPCLGQGPDVRLAGLRGVPTIVNIWQSYCGPCAAELPMLGQVARSYQRKVRFIGIDLTDQRSAALDLAARTDMGFASVQDPDGKTRSSLRVIGVPTTLFVRPDGTIAGRSAGQIQSTAELTSMISQYLKVGPQ